jgi:uncharacterized membrane protein (DUF106 family)
MVTSIVSQTSQTGGASAGSSSGSPAPAQPEMCGGTSGFVMVMVMMIMMFIIFDPDLRFAIAFGLDPVFSPIFAFDGRFPVLTLLLTAVFLIAISTSIRHFMTDWIGLARAQERMSSYQKEVREATLANNQVKMNKLQSLQPEIMQMQSMTMINSLKPAIFTMIIFVVVFPWLWAVYIESLSDPPAVAMVTLPWEPKWAIDTPLDICPGPYGGYWIILYFILSLPFGLLFQHGLKMISYSRKIQHSEELQYTQVTQAIDEINIAIDAAKDLGVVTSKPQELIRSAKSSLENKDYFRAMKYVKEADDEVNRISITHKKTDDLLKSAETSVKAAEDRGVGVKEARKAVVSGRNALKKSDFTTAIYFAKQAQRKIKDAKEQHKDAMDMISSVKATMYDMKDLKTNQAEKLLNKAEKALKDQSYEKVVEHARESKKVAEEVKTLHRKAEAEIEAAKAAIESGDYLGVKVEKAVDLIKKAQSNIELHNYQQALNLGSQARELAEGEKNRYQEASEAVNFAKLIISNAKTFGASVNDAEALLTKAETALHNKNYTVAITEATRAKDIAEQAKRQQQRSTRRSY